MKKQHFAALAMMCSAVFVVAVLAQMGKEPDPFQVKLVTEEGKLPRYEMKLNFKPDQSSPRAVVETYCKIFDGRSVGEAANDKAEAEFRAWRSELLAGYESKLMTEAMQKEVLRGREWDLGKRHVSWRGASEIVAETRREGAVVIETRQPFRDSKAVRRAANNAASFSNGEPSNRAYSNRTPANRAPSNRAWSNAPSSNKSWSMQGNASYGNAIYREEAEEQEDRLRFTCTEAEGVWRISLIEQKAYIDDAWGEERGGIAFVLRAAKAHAAAPTDLPAITLAQASAEEAATSLVVSLLKLDDDTSFLLELRMYAAARDVHLRPLLAADYITKLEGEGRDFPKFAAPVCKVESSKDVNGATRVVLLFEPEDPKASERRVYVDSIEEGDKWLVRECGWVNKDREQFSYEKASNPYYLR